MLMVGRYTRVSTGVAQQATTCCYIGISAAYQRRSSSSCRIAPPFLSAACRPTCSSSAAVITPAEKNCISENQRLLINNNTIIDRSNDSKHLVVTACYLRSPFRVINPLAAAAAAAENSANSQQQHQQQYSLEIVNNNTNNTDNNNNNKNQFFRPPSSALFRLFQFNQHLSSSCSSSKLLSKFSHYYQYRHQHHLSSSSSLSLSSPMMLLTMSALCSPSRMCSSSSSSSQPLSESSNNRGNQNEKQNNDENDKIDVTSFAETAKKILQDQKIAPLIFNFVSGRDVAAKLNGLQIITVYDWYKKKNNSRSYLTEAQIKQINDACSSLCEKAVQRIVDEKGTSLLRRGSSRRHAPRFGFEVLARDKIINGLSKLVRKFGPNKENQPLIIIRSMPRQGKTRLGDELGYRRDFYTRLNGATAEFDAANTFIFNLSFNSVWQTRISDFTDLSQLTPALLKNLDIQIESTILSAIITVTKAAATAEKVRKNEGRTSLTVEEEEEIEKSTREKLKKDNVKLKYLLVAGQRELCRRIVAAAMGVFDSDGFGEDVRNLCDAFIEIHQFNLKRVCEAVKNMVTQQRGVSCEGSTFVFIFDEITELGDLLAARQRALCDDQGSISPSSSANDTLSSHFYSAINSIIGEKSVVILSGFSEPRVALGGSGRRIHTVDLQPISSVKLRRELHVMKANYFNYVSHFVDDEQADDAILYYELTKSNPGLLGTILERLIDNYDRETSIMQPLVESIPIIYDLTSTPKGPAMITSMLQVLKLKSAFFGISIEKTSSTCSGFIEGKCKEHIRHCIVNAMANKVVDAAVLSEKMMS